MSNRANPKSGINRAAVDPLQSLMDSCYLRGRKAIIPPKPPKLYFDADRFRWLATQPDAAGIMAELQAFYSPKTLGHWRDAIDQRMHEAKWDYE